VKIVIKVNVPPNTVIGHFGGGFYRANNPNQQHQSTEGQVAGCILQKASI